MPENKKILIDPVKFKKRILENLKKKLENYQGEEKFVVTKKSPIKPISAFGFGSPAKMEDRF